MAELVDALDLKSSCRDTVRVRFPPAARIPLKFRRSPCLVFEYLLYKNICLRVSYSGYYATLPWLRDEFDSRYPLQQNSLKRGCFFFIFFWSLYKYKPYLTSIGYIDSCYRHHFRKAGDNELRWTKRGVSKLFFLLLYG